MPFEIIRNDITKVAADAIVNTADPEPAVGPGVDLAIYNAAGYDELLAERRKIGSLAPGTAAATPAFGLKAKYIIHTVGPAWEGGDAGEVETVARCYGNSLELAEELGCESIAFPLISTGTLGFPKDLALRAALGAITEFLLGSEMKVTLVVYDPESFVLSGKLLSGVREYVSEREVALRTAADERMQDMRYGAPGRAASAPALPANKAPGSAPARGLSNEASRSEPVSKAKRRVFPYVFGGIGRSRGKNEEPPETREPEKDLMRRPDFEPENAGSYSAAPVMPTVLPDAKPTEAEEQYDDLKELSEIGRSLSEHLEDYNEAVRLPSAAIDERLRDRAETFQEYLFRMIDRKGLKDPEVYKAANISRKLFSKIRSDVGYNPSKRTALALAMGLRLNRDETRDLLLRAGLARSPSDPFDIIVDYCISEGIYDIIEVNCLLFDYGLPLLGGN